ncbi:MAG TPA: glycosyl hydrolase family 65 protein [Ideonella sp.]|uniref:glycoside hydrolase family 65 protein n=1 Tax=Ideonella sp. TaxID=1929293 RepID=UPI002E36BC96|nr:glycosyl hydrolase family 65 protein [Ideonella sp.]HEX5687321.1 glycosyl hydrolase family 65 protein [Ideonella sp.]
MNAADAPAATPYAPEPWGLTETQFDPQRAGLAETLFALGNGRIGLRGAHDEPLPRGRSSSQDGNFLNGLFEREAIHYPEDAFGLARHNEFMPKLPNGKAIELTLGDECVDLAQGQVVAYERRLDFRRGVLTRHVQWRSPRGRVVAITSERIVSFTRPDIYAVRYHVTALDAGGPVRLLSTLDACTPNVGAANDPRVGAARPSPLQWHASRQAGSTMLLMQHTEHSGLALVSALDHVVDSPEGFDARPDMPRAGERLSHQVSGELRLGQSVTLTKFGCYLHGPQAEQEALAELALAQLATARRAGFDTLCEEQAAWLADYWQHADVEVGGDDRVQQSLRFGLFHLLQSAGRDGATNIAAKGLTGEGYEGHSFWDTEIYVLPVMLWTAPAIARALLEYRWRALPAARQRAREMAHAKGALFPWRTITGGTESSAYFPAGTAQAHINADIAHAVKQYAQATGDTAFMTTMGAELVLDTARIWLDLGHHDPRRGGAFCIHEVTGPDEYTAMVDNNFYTNAMAQQHLAYAAELAGWLAAEHPVQHARIAAAIDLGAEEPARWRAAAAQMYLPVDAATGVHPQDDGFLHKPRWPFSNGKLVSGNNQPLLLHYHPLVIYRHQVCKQADVVLALLLRGEQFTFEQKCRDFDYYEPLTTHDSSLSACVYGIVAAEIGRIDTAFDYFMRGARTDLDNTHGNTHHGVHTAALAGAWLGLAQGFGGLRLFDGRLHFAPCLPAAWTHFRFRLHWQGARLEVTVQRDAAEYRLTDGAEITLWHHGLGVTLSPDAPSVRLPLAAASVIDTSTSPPTDTPCPAPTPAAPSSSISTAS